MNTADAERVASPVRGPAQLTPGYFAGVMGTGIVSIGAQLTGYALLASILFGLALAFYAILIALTIWRVVLYRQQVVADLHDPARAFGFFTFIAATNVVASMFVGIGLEHPAAVLLVVATAAWALMGYAIPWLAVLSNPRRPILEAANRTAVPRGAPMARHHRRDDVVDGSHALCGVWFAASLSRDHVSPLAAAARPALLDLNGSNGHHRGGRGPHCRDGRCAHRGDKGEPQSFRCF